MGDSRLRRGACLEAHGETGGGEALSVDEFVLLRQAESRSGMPANATGSCRRRQVTPASGDARCHRADRRRHTCGSGRRLGYPHPTRVQTGVRADIAIGTSVDEIGRARDSYVGYMRNVSWFGVPVSRHGCGNGSRP